MTGFENWITVRLCVVFFMFFVLEVPWSWIFGILSFTKFGALGAIISSDINFLSHLSFLSYKYTNYMHIRCMKLSYSSLVTCPFHFYSFLCFSVCVTESSLYHIFRFTSHLFCNIKLTIHTIQCTFHITHCGFYLYNFDLGLKFLKHLQWLHLTYLIFPVPFF